MRKNALVLAVAAILWAVLAFGNKAFLLKNGDLSLFLFEWSFLKDSFLIPGGFLSWAGSFFTQFLLVPWLGALLWVIMLVTAYILTIRVFDLPHSLASLAVVPVALLVIGNMSLGYGIYVMRSQDYFFAPVLGYLLVLTIMSITWCSRTVWRKLAVLALLAFAGFWLAGVFALAGVAAAGIGSALEPTHQTDAETSGIRRLLPLVESLVLCIAVPVVMYGLFTSYRLEDSWTLALPAVFSKEWTASVRIPYWILFAFAIMTAALRPLWSKAVGQRHAAAAGLAVFAASVAATCLCWNRDSNLKTELEMSAAVACYDWKEVVDIFQKVSTSGMDREKDAYYKLRNRLSGVYSDKAYERILNRYDKRFFEPTRLMVIYRDLALLKLNKALDMSFTMRDGAKPQNSPIEIPLTFQTGPQIYFNYGLVNMAYRWCLENQAQFGWSFHTLKYMAMYAVVMNEPDFAAKFLNRLDHTLFLRKWSRSQRPLSTDSGMMAVEMPYREIVPYMDFEDYLSMDGSKMETYLMIHFIKDRGTKNSPEFLRASMLWAMRSKDPGTFWEKFIRYFNSPRESRLPRHVQEAVMLYNSMDPTVAGIHFDDSVRKRLSSFQEYVRQSEASGGPEPFPAWLKFGDTFFYYYLFQDTEPF